jgi:hypothetical protein
MESVEQLLTGFRQAAIEAGDLSDSKAQNRAAQRMQECYKALRTSEKGKLGIIGLMSDPDPGVRLSAAARCLLWVPDQARAVLEALYSEPFPVSFEAEMALKQFEKGNLSFDF